MTRERMSVTDGKRANGVPKGFERPVIRLFGPLSIEDGERTLGPGDLGGVRPKQVLEILLTARGHRVPIDRLAELVWGDERPQNVPGSLQTFVSTLRRHLTPDRERARELVVTESEAYRFATELVSLDLDRFDELLERSAHEPTDQARASLEQALALVRGEVLEDEPYATWALDVRGSYQGRVLGARLDAADAALAELDFAPALAHAEAAAALDGFSERAYRTRMLALYALGRPHEALSRYREFRIRLDEELGLEPGGDAGARVGHPPPGGRSLAAAAPDRAVAAQLADAAVRLLGREAELDLLVGRVQRGLDDAVLVQVEGEAGLGKTRLLDELSRARRRAGRARELLRARAASALRADRRRAAAGVRRDRARRPASAGARPDPSGARADAPPREFDEVEVLEALVAVVADHAPLVLVLDDLQWADPSTLAALAYLRRRGTGSAWPS